MRHLRDRQRPARLAPGTTARVPLARVTLTGFPLVRVTLALVVGLALLGSTGCGRVEEPAGAPPPVEAPVEASTAASAGAAESGEPDPAPTAAVAACALVSQAEAERLAGTPLGDAVTAPEACTYTGPVTGPTAQVEVYVGDGAKKQLDIERALGHELIPVSGAGDEAYLYVDGAMVFVGKGDRWFSIRLVLLDDPAKHREPLEDLARTAAGRF